MLSALACIHSNALISRQSRAYMHYVSAPCLPAGTSTYQYWA